MGVSVIKQVGWGYRHAVAVIGFLSFVIMNTQRLSFGVTIVAMINRTAIIKSRGNDTSQIVCPVSHNISSSIGVPRLQGEFNWSSELQGYMFGASFFGMLVALLPGAKLSEMFRAKRMALYGALFSSLATGLSPLASRWHVYSMIIAQFVRGVGQGVLMISFFVLMANWFPRAERGRLSTFVISGHSVGAIFAGMASGWICDDPRFGWTAVFYFVAGLGILLSLLILFALHETPTDHPKISVDELEYISENKVQVSSKAPSAPWCKIFTSIPTYALMIGLIGQYWTYAYFWSVHSTFLGAVLNFPIDKNGYFSALPYFMKAIGEYSTSSFSDWLQKKNFLSVTALRKSCNSLGAIGFSASILGIYFAGCNGPLSAVISSIAMFFVGVATPGALITCMDMSQKFAGSLSGLMNTAGSTAAFLFPIIVGNMTPNQTLSEWHNVFFLTIAVILITGLIFAVFGSAETQSWNFVESPEQGPSIVECNELSEKGTRPP